MSHQNISHLTGWRRCIGCLIFIGHFAQKSTMSNGSFAKRNQQRKASWYTCCRVAKTYRMPYLGLGCVLQKSQPYNYWLFCGKRRDVACVHCDMSHHHGEKEKKLWHVSSQHMVRHIVWDCDMSHHHGEKRKKNWHVSSQHMVRHKSQCTHATSRLFPQKSH